MTEFCNINFCYEGQLVGTYKASYSLFNGGEVNLRLSGLDFSKAVEAIVLSPRLQNSNDVIALAMLVDTLRREYPERAYVLQLGYTPYARQDRVCNRGEALSIKVFCELINSLNFDEVTVIDPHSDVTPALLNNVTDVIGQERIISLEKNLTDRLTANELTLVSPDAGATKKTEKISKYFGGLPIIQGVKNRDLSTGELSGFGIFCDKGVVEDKDLLIVDDICDGGGTFLGLAKVLKEHGARSVELYVTHGIFSKGVDILLDSYIDVVYTTNTWYDACLVRNQPKRFNFINVI